MAEPVDIQHLIRQTRRYEFSDGLRDLQLAALFVVMGVGCWFIFQPGLIQLLQQVEAGAGRLAMWVVLGLIFLLPAAFIWFLQVAMKLVRRRWLWRESGMVQAARRAVPRGVLLVSALIAVGVIVGAAALRIHNHVDDGMLWRAIWAAAGWSTAWIMIGMGQHLAIPRYGVVGLTGALISAGVLLWPLSFGQTGLWFGLLWGILFLASGTITLIRRAEHDVRNHRHQPV